MKRAHPHTHTQLGQEAGKEDSIAKYTHTCKREEKATEHHMLHMHGTSNQPILMEGPQTKSRGGDFR